MRFIKVDLLSSTFQCINTRFVTKKGKKPGKFQIVAFVTKLRNIKSPVR